MENFVSFLIPALLLVLVVRLMLAPMKLAWKILVNALGGLVCLFLLNLISGITGIYFAINPVTVLIAGILGLPGIGFLALVQLFL